MAALANIQSLNRHKLYSLQYFSEILHLALIKVQRNSSTLQNFASTSPHLIKITTERERKQAEVCLCVQTHAHSSEEAEGALLNLGMFPKRLKKEKHI